ncbi:uncharacterized protein LOC106866031 [Brachypodium distachyon]|uniref:uncharacterized protein LOC106866031 n=1 Tax=Brachypodium distachyon TaxID=15368 RepID=UPI00071CD2A4|nr:uncharacterized protein LOC106866031 [Brachypodium distachyon]|eukprot:XP_024314940.1 uncharacterized protein LOC106866031 [Brachypodium distachyon]
MLRGCGTNIGGSRGAARCVAARDNAVIAATLVARESAVGGDVARRKAAESAAGEAAQGHRVARRIAAAAAWAARKASVRCAAECYHAVAAASAARKVAAGCAAAGGDGEAVSTARDVADLCVAVLGDAANDADREAAAKHVVPHADAAALAAREAAAICDAAIADPAAGNDNDFLEKMRGWLMTVATLFVSMAFQAMVNPPGWMFDARRTVRSAYHGVPAAGAPSPDAGVDGDTSFEFTLAIMYLLLNMCTLGTGLSLVLLTDHKEKPLYHDVKVYNFFCGGTGLNYNWFLHLG